VPSVMTGTCHLAQSTVRPRMMLAADGNQPRPTGGDVTTIFLVIAGMLFALTALGLLWIRATAVEYRHKWSVPADATRGAYRQR